MASPSATAGAHLRTLALLCLIVSYDLSWVVCLWPQLLVNSSMCRASNIASISDSSGSSNFPAGVPHVRRILASARSLTLLPSSMLTRQIRQDYCDLTTRLASSVYQHVISSHSNSPSPLHVQAACASAFPSASLGQLFLWLHDTALIFIEAGQALASYAVHVVDRVRAAAAARGKVGCHTVHFPFMPLMPAGC